MDTVVIIAVAVIVVAAVLFLTFVTLGRGVISGGERLKQRFGPEYHRAVARQDGDVKAAEWELRERVKRHGAIRERPLPEGVRERYTAHWIEIQQRFVDSPREAVSETETLLARLAKDRGYPDVPPIEEQIAAISVHHGDHVHGYRSVHTAAHDQVDTEGMRQAMAEARVLFDELATAQPTAAPSRRREHALPAFTRRHPKGSDTA